MVVASTHKNYVAINIATHMKDLVADSARVGGK